MMQKKSGLEDKIKQVVKDAAGDKALSDDALEQIAGGLANDLAARFSKAGLAFAPGMPMSSSNALPEKESD